MWHDHTVSCNEGLVLFLGPISLRVSQPMGIYQQQKEKRAPLRNTYVLVGCLSAEVGLILSLEGALLPQNMDTVLEDSGVLLHVCANRSVSFVLPRMKELVSGGCQKQNGGPMEDVTAL